MGTSALTGFVVDGEVHAAYSQYDGYPSGLGEGPVRKFVGWLDQPGAEADARERIAKLTYVDEAEKPTAAQLAQLGAWRDAHVSTGDDWYSALRNAQGNLAAYLTAGYFPDNVEFANDSLFCEWAYLVNFDTKVVEFYRGFVKGEAKGRFANAGTRGDYAPITLVAEVPWAVARLENFWTAAGNALRANGAEDEDNDAEVQLLVSVIASAAEVVPAKPMTTTTTRTTIRVRTRWTEYWGF
jgi:hypothetical protein